MARSVRLILLLSVLLGAGTPVANAFPGGIIEHSGNPAPPTNSAGCGDCHGSLELFEPTNAFRIDGPTIALQNQSMSGYSMHMGLDSNEHSRCGYNVSATQGSLTSPTTILRAPRACWRRTRVAT